VAGPPTTVDRDTRAAWIRANAVEPIVDLGCADSTYFDASVDYVGLDVDPDSPDIVGDRPRRFLLGDATRAPIRTDAAATVVLAEILEHLRDPAAAISEARRIATDRVLITVPDEARWRPAADPGSHDDHERIYTAALLRDHLLTAGVLYGDIAIQQLTQPPFAFFVVAVPARKTL